MKNKQTNNIWGPHYLNLAECVLINKLDGVAQLIINPQLTSFTTL